jgi:repressor LexA
MTPRQQDCLEFVRRYVEENGYSPSYDELRVALGLTSKSVVYRIVNALIGRGHLRREGRPGSARALVLTGACPTCGRTT